MRKVPVHVYVLITLVILAIDIYAYQAFRTAFRDSAPFVQKLVRVVYWGLSALLLLAVYSTAFLSLMYQLSVFRTYLFAALLLLTVSKLLIIFFLLFDDITRVARWGYSFFHSPAPSISGVGTSIGRMKFISQLGLVVGMLPLALGMHGIINNAYNYQFRRIRLRLSNLPDSFRGFKIVQLSDIHAGSFTATAPIARAIEKINREEADIIVFTGDLVNNLAEEMEPYIEIFAALHSRNGIFSVLGNHDYGDYVHWDNLNDKSRHFEYIQQIHRRLGWELLLDENRLLRRSSDQIAIIGVQNWSAKLHFPRYGNLKKAIQGTEQASVKLLLSHDPTHWEAEVCAHYPDIDITLSGHTHGAQFGVEWLGIRWSPSQYFYKHWAGLYKNAHQFLYVNRGFGFIGYPGRVGILPEVTIFELDKS